MTKIMKGYIHTIEVVVAASVVIIGLALIFKPYMASETESMKLQGYDALKYLDDSGKLRVFVSSNNSSALEKELKKYITYDFRAEICKDTCIQTTLEKNIVVINHYVAGYQEENGIKIDPKKIRVLIWQ